MLKIHSALKTYCTKALIGLMLTAAAGSAYGQQTADYLLHAGDTLRISVWQEADMIVDVVVRPDGRLAFPLAGEIVGAGRTTAQVTTDIQNRLKAYIPEAVVTVMVTAIAGNSVFVIGQVGRAGTFVMNPQMNVLQVLSLAGGMTPFAAVNDVLIIRRTATGQKTFPFKYNEVSRGRSLEQNIMLEAGDVVVVP